MNPSSSPVRIGGWFTALRQGGLSPGYGFSLLMVAGFLAAGWGVQAVRGGGPLAAPAFPANALFLAGFTGWLTVLSWSRSPVVAWMAGIPFSLATLLALGLLGAAGGIVPQAPAESPAWARSLGFHDVFHSGPFAVAVLLLLTNLGLATLRKVRQLGLRAWFFSLNHLGLWIALSCGLFGAGDVIRARMILVEGQAEAMVVDAEGRHGYLPFGLFLQRFYVEHFGADSGRPGTAKRFAADVTILAPDKTFTNTTIEVNRPLRRDGWTLYLTNYELSPGGQTDQCLIEAVRDPWLPGVYAGIFLLLGGSLAMLFKCPFVAEVASCPVNTEAAP